MRQKPWQKLWTNKSLKWNNYVNHNVRNLFYYTLPHHIYISNAWQWSIKCGLSSFFSFDSCGNFSCQSRKCCEVAPALPGNLGQYEWVKCLCTLEAASNWCCVWCWPLNPWGTGVLDVDTTSTPPCLFDAVVTTWPLSPRHQQAWLRLPTW